MGRGRDRKVMIRQPILLSISTKEPERESPEGKEADGRRFFFHECCPIEKKPSKMITRVLIRISRIAERYVFASLRGLYEAWRNSGIIGIM